RREGGRCRVAPAAGRRRALQPPRRDAGRRPRARVWSAAARVLRDEANVSESRRGARMKAHTAMALFVASTASVWPGGRATAQITLGFESVAGSLRRPVGVAHAGDGSGRLFIVEQAGRILIHDGGQVLPTPFLDVSALVGCCGEQGLLGLAFHPDYATNGLLYVDYTNTAGNTVIARYRVSGDSNRADPMSAQILLTVPHPFANHNG